MAFIGFIVLLAAADLYWKKSVEEREASSFPRELTVSGVKIMLHKKHNPGFSFGILKEKPEYVQMFPLAVTAFAGGMLACLLRRRGNLTEKLALSFTIGGALSNLYDRLVRNYVVDYFSLQYGRLKQVVFNLGDLFIFLGTGILLVSEVLRAIRGRGR